MPEHRLTNSHGVQYLLEQSRITNIQESERSYHVFYQVGSCPHVAALTTSSCCVVLQLLAGADKAKFLLESKESYRYLNQSTCYTLEGKSDKQASIPRQSCP